MGIVSSMAIRKWARFSSVVGTALSFLATREYVNSSQSNAKFAGKRWSKAFLHHVVCHPSHHVNETLSDCRPLLLQKVLFRLPSLQAVTKLSNLQDETLSGPWTIS